MNPDLAALTAVGPVCLDELVTVLAEYPTDHRWNGWILPGLDAWSVVKVAEALTEAYADTSERAPEIAWVDGDLVVTEYDGDEAYAETIHPNGDGLYGLGAYAWTWSVDHEAARAEYVAERIRAEFGDDLASFATDPGGWLDYSGAFGDVDHETAAAAIALVLGESGQGIRS